ncbi:MAG TPA: AAA family ATPase, partial [Draconibacterium sp.]|nr:AAA family ATPase [Draconibacterium sp.]
MQISENTQLKLAYDFLRYTNQNVFLTGKAGTGKTTFLKNLKKVSPKRMVVVAPTGVAAINAGGVTIHSFFQLPFGPQIPQVDGNSFPDSQPESNSFNRINRFSKNKINIIRSLDLLVIDEISMVRVDVLDAIDAVLRRFKNRYQPFGGVQLLMIGDLQQLAPVVKEDDWKILQKYYDTAFFFSSLALKRSEFTGIELQHIYRQSDQEFIDLLNMVRDNKLDSSGLKLLNNRFKPDFTPDENEGYITLTTHNYQAQRINNFRLQKLSTKKHQFRCSVEKDFPEYSYPADEVLELKTGAQVMFLKNDSSGGKRYYNGKIGNVVRIKEKTIEVQCPDETESIDVERDTWENTKYELNEKTSEIEENVVGKFEQFPLKLAWAITIHKSQGLTFEKAIIDARQSFAHGQVYVALSRCKSLEGLVLSTPLDERSVINDTTVIDFTTDIEQNQPGEAELEASKKAYEMQLLKECFDFQPVIRSSNYLLKIWNGNAP